MVIQVVPHEGTWIEIYCGDQRYFRKSMSFPTRERGLKWKNLDNEIMRCPSFPTRERGLKLVWRRNPLRRCRRSPRGNVD